MSRKSISPNELIRHLQKARVVKTETPSESVGHKSQIKGVQDTMAATINRTNRLMQRGSRNIIEPNRKIDYKVLRVVAERAWLINGIIGHIVRQTRPFLKPSTDNNIRGFRVTLKEQGKSLSKEDKELAKKYTDFFLNTGFGDDPDREDNLTMNAAKILRDLYTLDQVSTELQRTNNGQVYAYWAVDPATILKVSEEGYNGNDKIKYIQELEMITTAYFTRDDLIFDYQNPRTDVDHSGYGYSFVEQALDLIVGMINAFMYNQGFFTEDKLPRGMLLLQGDADTEEVEMIEDYLINVMSGGPMSKWKVPIIPAGGTGSGENGRKFEWVSLQGSNKDMEYSQWTEFMYTSVAALFGVDLEELGIRTSKSTSVIAENSTPRVEMSKARGLASALSFLEQHYQKILDKIDPRFDIEFMGYERDDPSLKNQTREAELRTFKTMDEIRAEAGLKPFKTEWSQIPLNPYAVQLFQASQQNEDQGGEGEDEGMDGMMQGGQEEQGGGESYEKYRGMMMGDGGEDEDQDQEEGEQSGKPKTGRSIYDEAEQDEEPEQQGKPKKTGRSIFDEFQKSIKTRQSNDIIEIII